jgi:hypothetical protein
VRGAGGWSVEALGGSRGPKVQVPGFRVQGQYTEFYRVSCLSRSEELENR